MFFRIISTFLFCIISLLNVVYGQQQDMLKQFLTVDNGLSHNEVTAIVQDNDGFIWIGTRGGLNRYDGYEFKVYNQEPENENSLVNPSVQTLFFDSKGNLWIGTMSGGISKYNPKTGKFSNIINNYNDKNKVIPAYRVISFYEADDGKMWIGTWGRGLYVYDQEKDEATQYLNRSRVAAIVGTNDGRIFVGESLSQGLLEYKKEDDSFVQVSDRLCRKIMYDEERNVLWFVGGDNIGAGSSKKGLLKLDLRNNKVKEYGITNTGYNSINLAHSYYSLFLDSKGKVWVGTWGTGLYTFNPENENFERLFVYPQKSQILNRDYDAILEIFEDNHNNIWLGTNGGGVCVLSQKLGFNSIGYGTQPNSGLSNSRVMSVLEDKSNNLWIGTIGNGLFWSPDRENYYSVHTPGLDLDRFFVIKYIFEDNQGKIWVGTNIGTYFIEFPNNLPQLISANLEYHDPAFKTTVVSFLDSHKMFWLGSLMNGLFLLDKNDFSLKKSLKTNKKNSGDMKDNRISSILKDSRERIWLGTYNGLHIYNPEDTTINIAERFLKINGQFTGNIITSMEEDKKGNIWIGTPNGLNRLSQKSENEFDLVYYTEKDGLVSNFIKGIACDLKGNIWFSTNSGISKYVTSENRFINFNESDGILGKNFTEASSCKNTKGEIFFGGTHGLTFFNPDEIVEHSLALKPVFTELKVHNQVVEVGEEYGSKIILQNTISHTDEIKLPYQQNKLEIHFSALDFVSQGSNHYEFKLENADNEWTYLGDRRFIIFNDLKQGDYILKVRSSNRHNIWSEEIAELKIKIRPPFWRTWYALLIYIVIAISIITVIRWNAVKQVQLANKLEMEKLQHEQDQKMSEMKLRFFTNISHEFRTPLTLILAPLKEILSKRDKYKLNGEFENKLNIIQNNSSRLMQMVNQLLDFRKVESGNMRLSASRTNLEDFVSEVCYSFHQLAQLNNIKFRTKSSLKTKEVWFDRNKMEIVLNNLISNAFKYVSAEGKIEVSLYEEEEEILLSVSDNGLGIPDTELQYIFERFYQIEKKENVGGSGIGLALSKRFVEMHKGSITVASEPNVNTEFVVSIPKGKSHLKEEEIVETEQIDSLQTKDGFLNPVLPITDKVIAKSDIKILIVDDNKEVREYLVELLSSLYEVSYSENGMQAISMIKENYTPDLIISDVMMPKMGGFEFCEKIRSREATKAIPFIFLTAKNDEQFRLQGTKVGANDYISKPFDPTLLVEKIKNIIEHHKQLQKQYSRSVRLEPSDIDITSTEEAFIKKVIEVIENNFQNSQFSSEVLAAELNRSYSSLYRKLKKLTGLSAAEFIRTIRIKRAAQLLADKEKTISEIAYEVGFNDVKHFRTVFQKQFACSPSAYREKL